MSLTTTVAGLLEQAARQLGAGPDARREAVWLLEHAWQRNQAHLLARPDAEVPTAAAQRFETLLVRRAAGTPLAYLLGSQPFWTFELAVTPAVLIPRADTEVVVKAVLDCLPEDRPFRVLELGTGSGAIALALAVERPRWRILATDLSAAALAVARSNADALQANVEFFQVDWFEGLPAGSFDAIVSNPPYIAADDPHLRDPDLAAEPREALVAGPEGLDALRHIARHAGQRLPRGGWLWLEHGWTQGKTVRALLDAHGYEQVVTHRDLGGRERATGGRFAG